MLIFPVDHLPRLIPVGVQTSKGVEEIGFNVSAWLDKWPEMTFEVWPTRPTETAAYPAVSQLIGDVLVWYVSEADTAFDGLGTVEIVGVAEGIRKPSGPCTTEIKKTSLGVTQEPPEGIKPYYDGMMEAAKVIKENVDVGSSGLYIVRATPDPDTYNIPRADRTQEEIRAAVAAGKTVLLVYSCVEGAFVLANEGRVFTYAGEIIKDNGSTCPTFEGYLTYRKDDRNLLMYWKAYVKPGGTVGLQGDSPKTRTPHKLKLTGAVTANFDGSEEVTVEIPQGGGSAGLVVTFDQDTGTFSHTVQQIADAYKNGGYVSLLADGALFTMSDISFIDSNTAGSVAFTGRTEDGIEVKLVYPRTGEPDIGPANTPFVISVDDNSLTNASSEIAYSMLLQSKQVVLQVGDTVMPVMSAAPDGIAFAKTSFAGDGSMIDMHFYFLSGNRVEHKHIYLKTGT